MISKINYIIVRRIDCISFKIFWLRLQKVLLWRTLSAPEYPPSPYSFRIGLRFLFPVQRYNIGRPLWGHQVHGCQTLLLTDLRYLSQGRFSEIIRPLSSVINTINYLLAPCRISARRYRKKEDVDKGAMRERTLPHDVFDDRLGAVNRKGRRLLDEDDGRVLLIKTVFSRDAVRGKRVMTRNPLFKGTFTTRMHLPER